LKWGREMTMPECSATENGWRLLWRYFQRGGPYLANHVSKGKRFHEWS
jgi:hypothetical protein